MRSVIFVTALIGCIVPVLVPPVACAITPDEAKPGPDVTIRLHGCVFADANGNRKQDPGEKPLAGVRVHDFWQVVLTDKDGRYDFKSTIKRSLDPPQVPVVYITLPAGYSLYKVTDYYRYVKFEGKTGFEADFPLKPDPTTLERNFCWIASGDGLYQSCLKRLGPFLKDMDRKPRFLLTLGDSFLGSFGSGTRWGRASGLKAEFGDRAMDVLRERVDKFHDAMSTPVFNTMGNHHCKYQWILGPPCYSFNWGGLYFITRGVWQKRGAVGDAELALIWQSKEIQDVWLKREIAAVPKGTPLVHLQHYRPGEEYPALWGSAAKAGVRVAALHWAHSHRHALTWRDTPGQKGKAYGVDVGACVWSLCRNNQYVPFGFWLVGVTDGKMWASYELDHVKDFLKVVSPAEGGKVSSRGPGIVVNAGGIISTVTSVRYKMSDAGTWKPLKRTGRYTWRAPMPTDAKPSKSTLHVEATTLEDKKWTQALAVTVVAAADRPRPKPEQTWAGPGGNEGNTANVGATGKPPLTLAWVRNVGAQVVLGGPVLAEGRLHLQLARYSLDQRSGIVTLDPTTGEETSFATHADLKLNHLTPLDLQHSSGRLFVTYPFSLLGWSPGYSVGIASDARTGKRLWVDRPVKARGVAPPKKFTAGMLLAPRRSDSKDENGKRLPHLHLCAIDANERKLLWTSDVLWSEPGSWDVERNGFETPAVDSKTRRAFTTVACISLDDGKTIWKHEQTQYANPYVWQPAVALGEKAVFAHGAAWGRDDGKELWNHPRTGTDKYGRDTKRKMASFTVVAGDVVVFAWHDGVIHGHDIETGKQLWEAKTELTLYGGLAVMDGAVYAVSESGVVVGLDAKTGKEAWRKDLGIPIFAYPAASGNTLYVADWNGNVYAFVGTGR